MGTPLQAMRPVGHDGGAYGCRYAHALPVGGVFWYAQTVLYCEPGYVARARGVCVKRNEVSAPSAPSGPSGLAGLSGQPSACGASAGAAGATRGNPVQISSGAKVQTDADLVAGASAWLRIDRTYRSLHNGRAQSGGIGWSFSFDRLFTIDRGLFNDSVPTVRGNFGDGSLFTFTPKNGDYVSRYGKGMSLKALGANYTEWLLTTADGTIEHYKKIGKDYKLIEAHAAAGGSASFSYDADNRLVRIADSSGRALTIGWHAGEVETIDGPNGGVKYEYDQAEPSGQAAITYDEAGSVLLSEHAGGADRYSFDYPNRTTRRATDPLGTERVIELGYFGDTRGRIVSESQPAGAGCGAGAGRPYICAKCCLFASRPGYRVERSNLSFQGRFGFNSS